MTKKIQVEPPYYIPARFVELENWEVLCDNCNGTGKITTVFRNPGPNTIGTCWSCNGGGKNVICKICGKRFIPYKAINKEYKEDLQKCPTCLIKELKNSLKNNDTKKEQL